MTTTYTLFRDNTPIYYASLAACKAQAKRNCDRGKHRWAIADDRGQDVLTFESRGVPGERFVWQKPGS